MSAIYSPATSHLRTVNVPRERTVFDIPDVISAALVPLMIAASLGGLLIDGVYRDNAWAREANRGNDVVTAVLAVPLLAVSLVLARRGSARARLVWFGAIAFNVYNYAFYLFAVTFNKLFLLYAVLTAASLITLIAAAPHVAGVAKLAPTGRVRLVSGYMLIVGAMFAILWTVQSLQFAINGELPTLLKNAQISTNPVFALDFLTIIPGFLFGAILLLRRAPWGLVLALTMNVLGFVYMVALTFGSGFQSNAGIADSSWTAPPWIELAMTSLVATALLLRHIERDAPRSATPATRDGRGWGHVVGPPGAPSGVRIGSRMVVSSSSGGGAAQPPAGAAGRDCRLAEDSATRPDAPEVPLAWVRASRMAHEEPAS